MTWSPQYMLSEFIQQQRQVFLPIAYLFNWRGSRMVWDISGTEVEFISKLQKGWPLVEKLISKYTDWYKSWYVYAHWLVQGEMSLKELGKGSTTFTVSVRTPEQWNNPRAETGGLCCPNSCSLAVNSEQTVPNTARLAWCSLSVLLTKRKEEIISKEEINLLFKIREE